MAKHNTRIPAIALATVVSFALSIACGIGLAWAVPITDSIVVGNAKLSYEVESGEATITKIEHVSGPTAGTYEVNVPESVSVAGENGLPDKVYLVTAIGDNACGTSVTKEVGNSYTVVENAQITRVTLPPKLLSIGSQSFAGCTALSHVEFAKDAEGNRNLQTVGDFAFYGCAIDEAVIPDTVTTVGVRAFANCANVGKIHLPASQLVIDDFAFSGTEYFSEIEIPEGCTAMPRITMSSSVSKITVPSTMAGKVILHSRGSDDTLGELDLPAQMGNSSLDLNVGSAVIRAGGVQNALPEGIEELSVNGNFSTITLPSTLKHIETLRSSSLMSVTIPRSVIDLKASSFAHNANLKTVQFEEGSDLARIGENAFAGCTALEDIVLPSNVNVIGAAFSGCDSLRSVVIPAGVVRIGGFPFDGCANLESIAFQSGLRQLTLDITGLARNCPKLKRVALPDMDTPHTLNASTQYFKFLENCPALEGIYTYDPNLAIDESWISGCGDFKVYGWGVAGSVLDYAECSGHEFVPYAELDSSGYNGCANTQVKVMGANEVSAETSFSLPTAGDYSRMLAQGVDYDLVREGSDGDACLVVSGKTGDDSPQTCFGTVRMPVGRDISQAFVLPIADQLFLGDAVCPAIRASWQDGTALKAGQDYLVTYEGNEAPGMASATLVGMGSYAGTTKTVEFLVVGTLVSVGDDRVANALAAARQAFGSEGPVETAVLAWSHDYAAIFAADCYAAAANAPIVLSSDLSLDAEVKAQLASWRASKVIAVGSIASSNSVSSELASVGIAVDVVEGNVALKLLDRGSAESVWSGGAVVASPSDFANCMLAAAYAASMRMPLVYVDDDGTLPQSALDRAASPVTIVGDYAHVDASAENALGDFVSTRVQGTLGEVSAVLGNIAFEAGAYSDGSLVRVASPADVTAYATWPAAAAELHVPLVVSAPAGDASVSAFFESHASRIAGYYALNRSANAPSWGWLVPHAG